jgi:hypothetical protein
MKHTKVDSVVAERVRLENLGRAFILVLLVLLILAGLLKL